MKISQAKKLRRDICKTMGHDFVLLSGHGNPNPQTIEKCTRCKKKAYSIWGCTVTADTFILPQKPTTKYGEIVVKRFNPLDRAKEKVNKPEET